ncbi:calpain-9-like [Limulus polyphemus]|uniref:Calpain-9-like n=1 Tax=Limulus polyphemus TaxID=6850 RepID=A0ABM1SXN1_LIMPO|nr:calpain-9-like [Limulus polyphemus]
MGKTLVDNAEKPESVLSQPKSTTGDALGTGLYGYQHFRRLCRDRGLLFEDPDFPPTSKALFGKNKAVSSHITWLRPYEICTRPKFVSDGGSRCGIEQGEFGDSWLLAAISCLTLTPKFLDRIVPSDQSFGPGYCGIFRFRFWKFGEWVEVIVDDRLPTNRGRLIYLHSADPTEFWVALLEKAYAKFYGSYELLHNGRTGRVLQDLTGGIAQSFCLAEHDQHIVYQMINSAVLRSTMLAVSIRTDHQSSIRLRNGLFTHHVYSITSIAKLKTQNTEIPLVRLRNAWGKGEWNGAWSDRSWEWDKLPERDKDMLSMRVRNDGEFWEVNDDNLLYKDLTFNKPGELISTQNGYNLVAKIMHKLPSEIDAMTLLKILKACWRPLQILAEKPTVELCRHLVMLRDPMISGKIMCKDVTGLLYTLQFWRTVFLKHEQPNRGRTNCFNLRSLLWEAGVTVSNKVLESLIVRFAKKNVLSSEAFLLALVKLYLAHERYKTIEKKMRENTLSLEEMILMTIYS